jgi:hypothetical protein
MFAALVASGQGTFIYDQQSATELSGGGSSGQIQAYQPIGQSFTPAISSVGFIRLGFYEFSNGLGSTVYVNLRANSITGPILGSTAPVFLPDGFGFGGSRGYTNFLFSTPISVTPGTMYYFQPVLQSGDITCSIVSYHYVYSGGTSYFNGIARKSWNLWFREGILVPEPSALSLLIGSGALFYVRHKQIKMRSIG